MSESQAPVSGMGLPDDEYKKVLELLKKNRSVRLTNTKGEEHKFYMKNGELHSDYYVGLVRHTREVFNVSELAKQDHNSFRNLTRRRMKADHPEWDDAELDAQADVISEANETIKRLMSMGVAYEVAVGVVKHTLNSPNIEEEVNEIRKLLAEES